MKILEESKKEFKLDNLVREQMAVSQKSRDAAIMHQLALMDCGLDKYATEERICEEYGISREQLLNFRKWNQEDIELYKSQQQGVRRRIVGSIANRIDLVTMFNSARNRGDKEEAKKIQDMLNSAERYLPIESLMEMARVLNVLDEDPKAAKGGATQVNVQVNTSPALQNAGEALKKLREAKQITDESKVIDVKPEGLEEKQDESGKD